MHAPDRAARTLSRPRTWLQIEELEIRCMPAIRLDLVALHEFGHSLGLNHTSDPSSIMYAYYNPNYDLNSFTGDSAVATFQSIYSNPDASPWKDNLDGADDGVVHVTYSFTPDGVRLDSGKKNTLNATMNRIFGVGNWQSIFAQELNRWASVSNSKVAFDEHADGPYNFNVSGLAQNDSRFGDIRIGAHRFDGSGRVLAHTYFPPPNGATASGDAHFDQSEDWSLSGGLSAGEGGGAGGGGNLVLGNVVMALPVDVAPGITIDLSEVDVSAGAPAEDAVQVVPALSDVTYSFANKQENSGLSLTGLDPVSEETIDYFVVLGGEYLGEPEM